MAGQLSPPIQSPSLTCTSLPGVSAALCDPSFPSKYYKNKQIIISIIMQN